MPTGAQLRPARVGAAHLLDGRAPDERLRQDSNLLPPASKAGALSRWAPEPRQSYHERDGRSGPGTVEITPMIAARIALMAVLGSITGTSAVTRDATTSTAT